MAQPSVLSKRQFKAFTFNEANYKFNMQPGEIKRTIDCKHWEKEETDQLYGPFQLVAKSLQLHGLRASMRNWRD